MATNETSGITVTICIGNSDDKLPQKSWAGYIGAVNECLRKHCVDVQFSGYSAGNAPWQNACWVFVSHNPTNLESLKKQLTIIRVMFDQESIAILEGQTEFI